MLTVFASLAASRKPGRGGVAEGTTRGGVPEGRMLAGTGTVRGEAGAGAFSSPAAMRTRRKRSNSSDKRGGQYQTGACFRAAVLLAIIGTNEHWTTLTRTAAPVGGARLAIRRASFATSDCLRLLAVITATEWT